MKNISKFISSFLIGVGIGAIIETVLTVIFKNYVVGVPEFVAEHSPAFVKIVQTLIYGGFGIVSNIISVVYENQKLPLLAQGTIHFTGILIYFLFAGFTLKWFTSISSALMAGVSFLIIYLIIWTVFYFFSKSNIDEINKKLN